MGENSKIEWCHHTFNPWRGCTKVSPACDMCYAETMSKRNPGVLGIWGKYGTRSIAAESTGSCPSNGTGRLKRKAFESGCSARLWQMCSRRRSQCPNRPLPM
jgi:protein gp37